MLLSRVSARHLAPAVFLICFCAAHGTLCAQQTSIGGSITDSSGAAIPQAIVKASPKNGGAASVTLTNSNGTYQLSSLPAAEYVLRIEAPGFAPAERSLTLLVGQTLALDLELHPATVSSAVDVIADVPQVETTSSAIASNIDPHQMHDIPLNGRNWMQLALLAPGITKNDVDSNSPIGGADGGKFQINVDGQQVTQNNSSSGFGQPRFSQDAVAEFQIITNRFDATQGRSMRAQVNVQTKSGSNQFHGTAYGYFRSDSFNASDPIAHKVLPYSDQQFGGTIGGPILRDKLWFFASVEGERQPATIFSTPTGFNQTFSLPTKTSVWSYLGRLDYQRSDTSRFSLRMNGFTFSNPFNVSSSTAHPSTAYSNQNRAASAVLSWSKIISPQLQNELKGGFNFFSYFNIPLVNSQEYRLGTVTVGSPYNYPSPKYMEVAQVRDDAFWLRGKHSIKAGGEYFYEVHHGYFPQYVRGSVTAFNSSASKLDLASIFPVWNDPSTWKISSLSPYAVTYIQGFGSFDYHLTRNTLGFWFQDDWKLSPRLTVNLGVRYDNDIGMLGNSLVLASGLQTPHSGDNNNIAPRLGFAWDLFGDRKTVIRGGGGLYYGDVEANQFYDQALFDGQTTIQASLTGSASSPINLLNPFNGATLQNFQNGTLAAPKQALQLVDPSVQIPYTVQTSIGLERQLGRNWTVSADYVWWRIYHEWVRVDQNLTYDPVTGFNINPSAANGRPDSRFTSILRFTTPAAAGAIYNGFQLEVKRRFDNGLSVSGGYTLARVKDSSGGAFYVPNNQFNLSDEWSNGVDDQRHTLNVNASYNLKWGFQLSGAYHFGSGADYSTTAGSSPFANGGSNRTFSTSTKVYDDPSLNYVNPANPAYSLVKRNAFYGSPIHRVDLRITKSIAIKERYKLVGIAECFNLLNHSNYGSYATAITTSSFGAPAQNLNLEYQPRMLQLAGRFEF